MKAGEVLARGLQWTGFGALLRRMGSWQGLLVLVYHRTGDGARSQIDRRLWSTSAEGLDQHLRWLERHFEVIGPEELDQATLDRRGRRVMVTFDDGYRDLYDVAYPVLQSNGVRALMFLCSGFIDRSADAWWDEIAWMMRRAKRADLMPGPWSESALPLTAPALEHSIDAVNLAYRKLHTSPAARFLDLLGEATGAGRRPSSDADGDWITWQMAREMQSAGHYIGAHTVSHPLLSHLPVNDQRDEIVGSLDRIEAALGERPRWFSYPVGATDAFTTQTLECARQAGVELAFSNYGGYVRSRDFAQLDVPRVGSGLSYGSEVFAAVLTLPQLCARRRLATRAPA